MPHLAIASTATAVAMGQQVYEREVVRRAAAALGPGWSVSETVVRSLRSPLPGTARLPFRSLSDAPAPVRRAAGRLLHPRGALVHRMDLSLPPGPHEVVTLHDTVAWRFPDEAPPSPHVRAELGRAAAVVCVSEFTAQEAVDFLDVRDPVVVPNGVDARFLDARPLDPAAADRLGVPAAPYVLHAGGASARKNLAALADAWPVVHGARPDVRLVLSGPPHPHRDALFGPLPGTLRVGRVPDADVPGLLAGAAAVVVPSLHEGFGLPVLEAMATGTPVVAADRSSLPEVGRGSAYLVEPDGPGLAEGLLAALGDDPDRGDRRETGRARAREFSWDRSAAGHAAVWRRVGG